MTGRGKWRVRPWVAVVSVIVLAIFGLFMYAIRPIKTAANTTILLVTDLQVDEFEAAYQRLCEAERGRLGFDEWVASAGSDYGFLADMSIRVLGAAKQYPDGQDLDRAIDQAWTELDVFRGEVVETWRLHMVREGEFLVYPGDWKVCGIEFRGERAA